MKLALPGEVENLMFNLIADWNEKQNITIKDIAIFHYKFELIHPFQDGNGRLGRFIILKQCIESNIDLIAIDNEYSEEYKKALYTVQKTNDIKDLVKVFEKCQSRLNDKFKGYDSLLEQINQNIN